MSWLEISLTLDGELAEAVADVLARFAPNGVFTEQGIQYLNEEDEGTGTGPVTVRAYLPVDAGLEERRHKLEESLYFLGRIQSLPDPTYREIADQNWMEAWKQHYRPIPIGERLMILPVWLESPELGRVSIKIDPGMAFGTGTHPTTQLCLELIEEFFLSNGTQTTNDRRLPVVRGSSSVIDIGCGSGILSIAALKLGARSALGLDIDPDALANALENAARNGIGAELTLAQGSVKQVLAGEFLFRRASLVVANILAPVISRLLGDGLAKLVEPGGRLLLSGILLEQEPSILRTTRSHNLTLECRRQMGDWVALAFRVQV